MSVDLTKLSNLDLAYIEGFIEKCADKNVDPEQFLSTLVKAAAEEPEESEDKPEEKAREKKQPKATVPAQAPDYEKRRRISHILRSMSAGGLIGATAGSGLSLGMSIADKDTPIGKGLQIGGKELARTGHGAALGGLAGAGIGAGVGALRNYIRDFLGYSSMGSPVTLPKE